MSYFEDKLYELNEMYKSLEEQYVYANEELDYFRISYKTLEERYTQINEELDNLKKNKEIQNTTTHSLYQLSDIERKELDKFQSKHYNQCVLPLHNKAKGNTYIYTLTNTESGAIIKVTCPICGATLNITDTCGSG